MESREKETIPRWERSWSRAIWGLGGWWGDGCSIEWGLQGSVGGPWGFSDSGGSEAEQRQCISNKLLEDAGAAGPGAAL